MMFNNDYFSKPNTSYSLFDLVDSNQSSNGTTTNKGCCKLLASNNQTLNNNCPTMFDFEDPLKCDRFLTDSNYEDVDGTCYSIGQRNDLFPFNEPTRFSVHRKDADMGETQELGFKLSLFSNSSLPSSSAAPTLIPKHKVLVEQAPFSVMKSFKSQEPIEKVNNVQVISSLRNHPYNNSKSRPITTDTVSLISANNKGPEQAFTKPVNTPAISNSDSSNLLLKKSDSVMAIDSLDTKEPQTPTIAPPTTNNIKNKSISRNSSSNAILAHLRSISPNFKSIFVRPKNVKPIDSSSIMNKSKVHYKNVSTTPKQYDSSILPLLYSNGSRPAPSPNSLFTMMHNIEPKEIRLNSSVDDVLRKFSDENGIISRTLKNLSNSSSVSSTISSMSTPMTSTRGDRTISATSSIRIALNQTLITPPTDSTNANRQITDSQLSPSSSLSSTGNSSGREKWTCMICLSKHPMRQDICAICGSEKPTTTAQQSHQVNYNQLANSLKHHQHVSSISPVAVSPSNELFSSYLIKELGLKHKMSSESTEQEKPASSMSAQLAPKVNPYLKKWTCIQCNFSNDSLKIVCLNCRWMKTTPGKKDTNENEGELANAKETKRVKAGADTPLSVDTASVTVCSSCKSPIRAEDTETPVEPKKLDFGAAVNEKAEEKKTEPTPNLLFGKLKSQTPKWTCGTCLVSNEETADKCACCSSAKPGPKPTSIPAATPAPVAAAAPDSTTLFKKMTNSQGSKGASKWTCNTCLVSNAEVNDKCACCMTPRPSSKPAAPAGLSSLSKPIPFASASAKWTCDTCLVSNDSDKLKCVCCQTDKPGAAKPTTAVPTLPQLTKGDTFKAPETSTIKFGAASSTSATTAAPITFGASSFSFKPATGSASSAAAPAFKFGSDLFKAPSTSEPTKANTTTDEEPAKKPASSFASLATNQDSTTPATTSIFKFGQPAAQPEPKPKTSKTTEVKPDQSLSTSSFLSTLSTLAGPAKPARDTSTTSSLPAFKSFGETNTSSTTAAAKKPEESISTFKFGETTASQATTKAPSFSFGSTTTTTPSFTFGGASSTTTSSNSSATTTTTATLPASSFSLFSKSTESKSAAEAKPLTFGTTTSTGTSGFGLFGKPAEQQQPSQTQPSSTLGSFFNSMSDKPATSATTTTTTATPSLFGNTAEAPKLTFGSLSSSSPASSLFGSKLADNKPAMPTFGQSTTTTSSTGSTDGLFSALSNQPQQQQTSIPSFNFFATPPSANTTPAAAASTSTTPSIFSTQTLTPNSANMQLSNNSFNFTPLSFNSNQQQPNPFVPNLAQPVINFTGNNTTGFVFSGSSDQQQQPTTDLVAQRRRAKAFRRQR